MSKNPEWPCIELIRNLPIDCYAFPGKPGGLGIFPAHIGKFAQVSELICHSPWVADFPVNRQAVLPQPLSLLVFPQSDRINAQVAEGTGDPSPVASFQTIRL